MDRGGVALDGRLEPDIAARDHHCHSVVGDGAGQDDPVARTDPAWGEIDAVGDGADTGRRHVEPVCLATLDNLRVARDDCDLRCVRGCGHRGDDPAKVGNRVALLDHEAGGQPERTGAGDGEVVHCPVHREFADVASREFERAHDVGVGRERDAPCSRDDGRVPERGERLVVEVLEEEPSTRSRVALPPAP